MQEFLKKIAELKKRIDNFRPLNKGELKELKKWYDVTYTYNSNAIEGNSLTLEETRLVIEDGLTIGGKQLREIYEAVNHKEAIDHLYEIVKTKKNISEKDVKDIHKIIFKKIDLENAGEYRKVQVYITGEPEFSPKAIEVPKLMKKLLNWLKTAKKKKENPLFIAAKWHYDFVKTHPFIDGNGRTARLTTNILLLQSGYSLQIIPVVRRREYIESLKSNKTFEDFYRFFLETQYENMKDYLRMIGK